MLVRFVDYKGQVVFINPDHVTSLQSGSDGVAVYDVSRLVSATLSEPIEEVAAKLNGCADTDRSSLSWAFGYWYSPADASVIHVFAVGYDGSIYYEATNGRGEVVRSTMTFNELTEKYKQTKGPNNG